MSHKRFDYIWKDVKDDRGLSEIHDFFIDNFSNKEYDLSDEKDIGYFLDLLDELSKENKQLKKIGIMYQGHNPCSNCTYCVEDKVCCAEVPIFCDDAKKNFVQGLCKKHKQIQKSIRRYDDE